MKHLFHFTFYDLHSFLLVRYSVEDQKQRQLLSRSLIDISSFEFHKLFDFLHHFLLKLFILFLTFLVSHIFMTFFEICNPLIITKIKVNHQVKDFLICLFLLEMICDHFFTFWQSKSKQSLVNRHLHFLTQLSN